ncbi:MAG: hypothetical protein KDD55_13985, partial [Bdellovibrionales bacterium]|nr:hypothetical protein [Bdellovibrionales bacterium]
PVLRCCNLGVLTTIMATNEKGRDMSEKYGKLLKQLIELSDVDTSLARIFARRKELETQLADKLIDIQHIDKNYEEKSILASHERETFRREEKRLKEENEKLIGRRKALDSFSDYKSQQAAQKEIEQTSRQLGAQEEKLVATLDSLDALEAEVAALKESLDTTKAEYEKFEEDAKGELVTLEERGAEKQSARDSIAQNVGSRDLITYDRIKNRFPMDPVVALEGQACGGCHMELGPQVMVQVIRAESLVKCRGCGRFLYMASTEEEAPK